MIFKIMIGTVDLRNAIRDVNFGVNYSLIIEMVRLTMKMRKRT